MNNQFLNKAQSQIVKNAYSREDYRDRRLSEMRRRFILLQSKRSHLERELETIKSLLLSLDKQMHHYSEHEQLF